MFMDFEKSFENKDLVQIIEFPTWSRIINNVLKESTLDHLYPNVTMNSLGRSAFTSS